MNVLLDTNFLLLPVQRRIDIYEEIERIVERRVRFLVPEPVWEELRRMASDRRREASRGAALCMEVARGRVEIIPYKGEADRSLLELAKKLGGIVATNDSELRRKLSEEGIPVICLRAGKRLVLFGEVV